MQLAGLVDILIILIRIITALEKLAKYLRGTIDYGLKFESSPPILEGYSDVN